MRTKYLNTLVAVAILASLWGGFTYYDKRKSREPSKTESKPEEKVLNVESSHVRSFTLKPRNGEPFVCQREGGTWAIVEPRKLPADQSNVSSFLNNLTTATVDEVVDPHASNLKDFGLDPPVTTVEISTDTKPERFTLLLGDETPTSGGLYAQVAGNPRVVMLASYMKSSLEKNLFDLRDKRAVSLDADQIQRIEVQSKGKRWNLAKKPEGIWDLVLPPPVRADRFSVEGLVNQLRNLSMLSVVAEDKKKSGRYGFESPTLTVRLSSPGGSQSLVLGEKGKKKHSDRYYAMNLALEPVFTLNSSFLTEFQKNPADLRDKDLFSFSTFEAKHLEVQTPKGRRVFEQQKDKWKQTSPAVKDEATDKVEALLNDLRNLRADLFPKDHAENLSAFGLTKPAYRFQVQFGEKSQTETVEVAKVGDHIYARRSTDPLPCELPKTALDTIDKALSEL